MATTRNKTKAKATTKPVEPEIVEDDEDEWEDDEETTEADDTEDDEDSDDETGEDDDDSDSDEDETAPEDEPEGDDEVSRVLARNPRRNERSFAAWLVSEGVQGVDVDSVHAVMGLYRVWRKTPSFAQYREEQAYDAEHKDEAIARRRLERLQKAQAKVEDEIAALEAAKLEKLAAKRSGKVAPKAKPAPTKAAPVAKAAAAKAKPPVKATAKGKAAALAVVPDDDEDDDF